MPTPTGTLEAGAVSIETGLSANRAEFKRKMEKQYKEYVARLKGMSRADELWELKNKQVLKQFADNFKRQFKEVGANLREFAEYQSRMMRELSASHSKVDIAGGYISSLKMAMEAAKGLYKGEITDLEASYKRKMKLAEEHRTQAYADLDWYERYKKASLDAQSAAESDYYRTVAEEYKGYADEQFAIMQDITDEAKMQVDDRLKIYKKEAEAVAELNKKFNAVGGKTPS